MQRFARAALVAAFLVLFTSAFAQSITPASNVVFTGGSTNITLSGPAGQQFGLIGSTTSSTSRSIQYAADFYGAVTVTCGDETLVPAAFEAHWV
jgi:hypothetical protein